jgi:uncharacterized membrane protein YqjE
MPDQSSELASAIQDVSEKAQLLVREEIALAKAEMTEKITKLVKGAVFGLVAGVFALFSLVYLLNGLSWGFYDAFGGNSDNFWLGFLITGLLILVIGAIAGFIAMRLIKKGTPPTPQLAIEEAQLIKGTLTSSPSAHPVGPVGARQAPQPAPASEGRG